MASFLLAYLGKHKTTKLNTSFFYTTWCQQFRIHRSIVWFAYKTCLRSRMKSQSDHKKNKFRLIKIRSPSRYSSSSIKRQMSNNGFQHCTPKITYGGPFDGYMHCHAAENDAYCREGRVKWEPAKCVCSTGWNHLVPNELSCNVNPTVQAR